MTEQPSNDAIRERRVLVTGGAGFIGSHILDTLLARRCRVEALDNLSSGSQANVPEGVPLHVADVRSASDLRALPGTTWDAIVHCAAQTSVERSMKDPEFDREVNVTGTRLLLEAARDAGIGRFVFMSSGGAIYGETKEPATEATLPAPRSYYGLHKYAAEEFVRASGLSFAIIRPSNVYGRRQRADAEGGVVAIFADALCEGRELTIHGDGSQQRDFVHVSDVVAAVFVALEVHEHVVWNVASGAGTSIRELAAAMASQAATGVTTRFAEARAGDVHTSLLSPRALVDTGLWGPPVALEDGLREILPPRQPAAAGEPSRPRRSALSGVS